MEDLKEIVCDILSRIVQKTHQIPSKRNIRVHKDSIAIACPYCGDSKKNPREKRGHFFMDSLKYYCYNEMCTSNITKLINDFEIDIDLDKRMFISQGVSNVQKENQHKHYLNKSNIDFSDITGLFNLDIILDKLKDEDYWLTNVKKVEKNSPAFKYLESRDIDTSNPMLYEGFRWEGQGGERVIIFMNIMDKNKVCSLQVRSIEKKGLRGYKVHVWSDLYQRLFKDLPKEIPENEMEKYDKLSLYFGLGFIDPCSPLTIFEGFLDSTLAPNSIGLTGAGIDTSPLEDIGLSIRYFYDNPYKDKTGFIASEKKIHEQKSVFLWKKFIEETSKGDKTKEKILKECKDLNDIEIHFGKNSYKKLEMEKYFSIDEFDIYWI